jgi:hypothetical protein
MNGCVTRVFKICDPSLTNYAKLYHVAAGGFPTVIGRLWWRAE